MKAEDVKIGMKVKIVKNPPPSNYGHGQVGDTIIITNQAGASGKVFGASGFTGKFGGSNGYIGCEYFEPVVFTKADLKTGMRVVYREGTVRVFVGGHMRDERAALGFSLNAFREDLLFSSNVNSNAKFDIMEVYAAPEKCEDFFNLDVRGELLFKREESPKKTEKQKQAEELLAKAAKLKEEFDALVKQAADLAGE